MPQWAGRNAVKRPRAEDRSKSKPGVAESGKIPASRGKPRYFRLQSVGPKIGSSLFFTDFACEKFDRWHRIEPTRTGLYARQMETLQCVEILQKGAVALYMI
jgi:hypothetical protein